MLFERYAELVECLDKFWVYLVHALFKFLFSGCRVVTYSLEIYARYFQMRPVGWCEREPVAVGFQPEIKQPFRFAFFVGNEADDIFREARRHDLGVYVGCEAVFVVALCGVLQYLVVIHTLSCRNKVFV